jgi:hypothetical protein
MIDMNSKKKCSDILIGQDGKMFGVKETGYCYQDRQVKSEINDQFITNLNPLIQLLTSKLHLLYLLRRRASSDSER